MLYAVLLIAMAAVQFRPITALPLRVDTGIMDIVQGQQRELEQSSPGTGWKTSEIIFGVALVVGVIIAVLLVIQCALWQLRRRAREIEARIARNQYAQPEPRWQRRPPWRCPPSRYDLEWGEWGT